MKTIYIPRFFAPLIATAMILLPATQLFADHNHVEKARLHSFLNLSTPPSLPRAEVVDAEGNPIPWTQVLDTSQTLLYTQDPFFGAEEGVVPILDPNGNHVNQRDWMRARGILTISCRRKATHYRFRFKNLIPNGVYTIWHFPDTGGGALATTSFEREQVDNVFHASETGEALFKVLAEPGPMTFGGIMPKCSLTGSVQELFIVLYHIDGEYCGPFPCNAPGVSMGLTVETAHLFFKR